MFLLKTMTDTELQWVGYINNFKHTYEHSPYSIRSSDDSVNLTNKQTITKMASVWAW